MKYIGEALFLIALMALLVVFHGEPDIVDGWAKRLNDTTCVE